MLAKDTLEEFKLECELRRLTPRTIKGYYNSTLLFLTWLERQHEIKELEAIWAIRRELSAQNVQDVTEQLIGQLIRSKSNVEWVSGIPSALEQAAPRLKKNNISRQAKVY